MAEIWDSTSVKWVKLDERAQPPSNAYPGDAGWDLHVLEDVRIDPGEGRDTRTGIAVAIPEGFFGRIVGRSSAFRKKGVQVVEGIIDAGYRGELFSYVYNPVQHNTIGGNVPVYLLAGDSVAQLIVQPVIRPMWTLVNQLPPSKRGDRGFGSSGR